MAEIVLKNTLAARDHYVSEEHIALVVIGGGRRTGDTAQNYGL